MAGLAGRGLNRVTSSIYGDPSDARVAPLEPSIDTTLFPGAASADEVQSQISQWIEGRLERSGEAVVSDARIFTLQRYLGQMQEVTP